MHICMYIYYIFISYYIYRYYIILYIYIYIICIYILYYTYMVSDIFPRQNPPPETFHSRMDPRISFFDVCDGGCYGDQLPHIWSSSSPVHRPSLNKIATEPVNSAQGGKLYIYIYIYYIYIIFI